MNSIYDIQDRYTIICELAISKANVQRMMRHFKVSEAEARDLITRFNAVEAYASPVHKDIFFFTDVDTLRLLIDVLEERKAEREKRKKQALTDAVEVFKNNKIRVLRIDSEPAAIKHGRNTEWCIAADSKENRFNEYGTDKTIYYVYWHDSKDAYWAILIAPLSSGIENEAWKTGDKQEDYGQTMLHLQQLMGNVPFDQIFKFIPKSKEFVESVLSTVDADDTTAMVSVALANKTGRIKAIEDALLNAAKKQLFRSNYSNYLDVHEDIIEYYNLVAHKKWPEAAPFVKMHPINERKFKKLQQQFNNDN